jgi:hypothetical protein
LSRNIGRAKRQIECECDQGHNQNCHNSGAPPSRVRHRTRPFRNGAFGIHGRQQPARYFNACGFGFRVADQSDRAIAIDLLELVLIHKPIAAAGAIARLSSKRPKNRKQCRGRHHSKDDPKCHQAKISGISLATVKDLTWPSDSQGRGAARLHHAANTAAMGVRARQFRTAALAYPEGRDCSNPDRRRLKSGHMRPPLTIAASRRKPRPKAYSRRWAPGRRKRLFR